MRNHDNTPAAAADQREQTTTSRVFPRLLRRDPAPPSPAGQSGEQPAGQGRFAELEAYRGIAAVLVIVFHAYQYSREALGLKKYVYQGTPLHLFFGNLDAPVAWFFTLSGFLLFLPFARAVVEQRPPQPARQFLWRRAIRVVPVYYLAIILVWTWRYDGSPDQPLNLLEHLTFTQIFDPTHIFWIIGPAWSLSVEVLFYLFLAIAGPLAYRAVEPLVTPKTRIALLAGGVAILGLASVAYKWWAFAVAHIPQTNYPVYFGPVAKLDTFALGMLLAVVVAATRGRPVIRGWVPIALRLAAATLIVVDFALRNPGAPDLENAFFHTLASVAFVLLLASTTLAPRGSHWERLLANPALRFLGLVSYSAYLWHEPLMEELGKRNILINQAPGAFPLNALILVALSIAVAAVSYWAIETQATRLLRYYSTKARDKSVAGRSPAAYDTVSIVAHEVRTALTSIQGFSEIFRDQELSAETVHKYAADINADARRLSRMVTEMLDLDRMAAGQMTLKVEQVDLNTVVADVAARIDPAAPRSLIHLRHDNPSVVVAGDRDKLTQVVTNLVDNAVHYSSESSEITITSRIEGDSAHLGVHDRGVGIPSDALEKVFEPYVRIEGTTARPNPGTGLGLPIVRQIVELHGGQVWAESDPGQGSSFHVTIPLHRAPAAV